MNIIFDFLQKIFGKKEIHLSNDSLTEYHVLNALKLENAELKAERDKQNLEKVKYTQTLSQKEEEEVIKYELNKKKDKIYEKKNFNYFSFGKLGEIFKNDPKLLERTFFTDFERGKKLDNYYDMGVTEDGVFVVVGRKNGVLWGSKNLKDVFFNVKGLSNDFNSGLIPLCLDSEGRFVENIITSEVSDVQRFGTKLQYTKTRKRPVYEIILEKNKIIGEQSSEIEVLEETVSELQQQIDNLKRDVNVKSKNNSNLISEISESQQSNLNIDGAFQSLIRKLEFESSKNMIIEGELEKLEKQNIKLLGEAETEGAKTSFAKAVETIQNLRREIQNTEPQIKIVEVPKMIEQEPKNKLDDLIRR
ncbi:MAG TPA: hypothetical protein VGB37_14630 [Candidatus Lokiarchaeia archaeon]